MLGLLISVALASTAQPTTLEYRFDPPQLNCPDESWVKNAIRARLGADPFVVDGRLQVVATIRREGQALVGELKVTSGSEPPSTRTLRSASSDCLELASSLELAVTVIIDQLWLAPPVVVAPVPRPAPVPVPVVATPRAAPPTVVLQAELLGAVGAIPGVTSGFGVGAQLRFTDFALGLDARLHWPTRVLFDGGEVSTLLGVASLVPCWAWRALQTCGVLTAGFIRLTGQTSIITRETAPFAAAGVGVSYGFRLLPWLALRPFLRAEVALTRLTIGSGPADLWVSAPVFGSLGLQADLVLAPQEPIP